jgi:Na+/H+ antiporter NhaB
MPSTISAVNYAIKIDYDANNNPIYVGYALPSTLVTAAKWQIMKITFDANNNPTTVAYPNGTDAFNFIWNSRTSYTYS